MILTGLVSGGARRALLGAALTLPAVLVAAPGAANQEEATAGPPVPDDVTAWFAESGPELVAGSGGTILDVPAEQLTEIDVGAPTTVTTWAPAVVEGTSLETPLVPLEQWVAPLTLGVPAEEPTATPTEELSRQAPPTPDGEDAAEPAATETVPVGVLYARRGETEDVTMDRITADTQLAAALRGRGANVTLVQDDQTGGWFGYDDGTVAPLTDAATEVLAGRVSLEVYQPFLVERYTNSQPGGPSTSGATDSAQSALPAPAWAALFLVGVLVVTAAVVWIRRPEKEEQAAVASSPERGP